MLKIGDLFNWLAHSGNIYLVEMISTSLESWYGQTAEFKIIKHLKTTDKTMRRDIGDIVDLTTNEVTEYKPPCPEYLKISKISQQKQSL